MAKYTIKYRTPRGNVKYLHSDFYGIFKTCLKIIKEWEFEVIHIKKM